MFDYSADGVRRSIDESLVRLGLERIDIAFIHDPDDHWQAAIEGAYPALHRLREEGVIGAIGAGMNQSAMLARFAREADFDVFLLAGRYTLLDQEALPELLPLCVERGIAIVLGGVMNSGILADPRADSHFDYRPAPAACRRTGPAARRGLRPPRRAAQGRRDPVPAGPSRRSSRSWPACAGVGPSRRLSGADAPGRSIRTCGSSSDPRASSRRTPRRPA